MPRPGSLLLRATTAVALVLGILPAAQASAEQTAQLPAPKAEIAVDAGTGVIVAGDHVHDALPPASLAKIMTALVAVERLPADTTVPVSARAAGEPAMKIDMQAGSRWPFEQSMASLMMVSANDAAYAIAEDVGGGSLDRFASIADATAHRLGMRDSKFSDPAGLDDSTSFDGGPRMSAYDLAIATRNALTVPMIANFAALRTYTFVDPSGQQRYLTNHNKMLPGSHAYDYAGATGFKTGFTDRANHTLVATATRNGRTCISVVLGAADLGYSTAQHLLDECFAAPASAPANAARIPEPNVSLYASRVDDRAAFAALARHRVSAANESAGVAAAAPIAARPSQPQATTSSSHHHHRGIFSLRNLLIVLVLLLLAFVMLRRRAVRRQRIRRLARKRARAAQMRSGGLTIVDGRYRTGMRLGKPVESHVRIHRVAGDGEHRRGTG